MWKPRTAVVKENEYISQPLQPHDNSTVIFIFSNANKNVTQFIKVLLVKLSDMLDSSNFARLFHCQSFALYDNSMSNQSSQYHNVLSTSTTGDDRKKTIGGITGKKRSSPTSQTDIYKFSRPLLCS